MVPIHLGIAREPGLPVPPFSPRSGGLGVGTNNSGINRQPLEIGIVGNPFQDPVKDPFPIALLRSLIGAEALGEITLTGAGTSQPEKPVEEQARAAPWPPTTFHAVGHIRFQPFPLIVA
ncbi:hypothetical protein GCM10027396_19470 [Insolitispirillum peregrinum]